MDREAIEALAELLDHRGPDHRGQCFEDELGVVHTRLSLLDLSSAAHQPFVDERYVLVYNGELYNFEALRHELEETGRRFATTSDTEVLFQLLASTPVDEVLPRLRGMFAFAFYDRVERRLTLARDRLGIKPLFYAEKDGCFAFASEWKALWTLVDPQLDETMALFSILGHADKARRRTLFRGLHQVEAGTLLVVDREGIHERRYYDVRDDIDETTYRELDGLSKREVVERFGELFEQSVRSMLIADAPLGTFVSGGVDSGLIAATARSVREVALFTSDVQGRHSEVEDARQTAAHLDAPLHRHGFEPERFLDRWTWCTWHYEAPIVTHTNAVPFADVAALARDTGVKAVLTGEGSDEMFLGYPRLLLDRYAKPIRLPYRALDAVYRRLPGFSRFVTSGPGLLSELEVQAQNYQRQRLRDDVLGRLQFVPARHRREQALTLLSLR
ncbi:MAG: asparagine synthase (glutamine-hydrolyzing), partial [Acidobacteriota bacterium]